MEPLVAKKFQPMLMRPAGQKLSGTLADAFETIAPKEAPVVQEEPQQVQIRIANVPSQEEVVSQAAVEVLDD